MTGVNKSNEEQFLKQHKINTQADAKIFKNFKNNLNESDYFNSLVEIEESLNQLSTANLMEIRSMA